MNIAFSRRQKSLLDYEASMADEESLKIWLFKPTARAGLFAGSFTRKVFFCKTEALSIRFTL